MYLCLVYSTIQSTLYGVCEMCPHFLIVKRMTRPVSKDGVGC